MKNDLNQVYRFMKEDQKERFRDLLLQFQIERFKEFDFLPDFDINEICKKIQIDIQFEKESTEAELASKEGRTTIQKEKWGVHITHCCKKHGCKYGCIDCPVELGLAQQKFLCEQCEFQLHIN